MEEVYRKFEDLGYGPEDRKELLDPRDTPSRGTMGSTGENFAPSFVKKPQLRQEDDGNRLIFECKLAGSPKPEVTWFREDVKLTEDDRTVIRVTEDGRNQYAVILDLNDVVETDAGLYKVKAKNKFGEVSASINLNFSREYLHSTLLAEMHRVLAEY